MFILATVNRRFAAGVLRASSLVIAASRTAQDPIRDCAGEISARGQTFRDGSNNVRPRPMRPTIARDRGIGARIRGTVLAVKHLIRPPSCRASRRWLLSPVRSRCNRAALFLRVRYDPIRPCTNDDERVTHIRRAVLKTACMLKWPHENEATSPTKADVRVSRDMIKCKNKIRKNI